MDIIEEKGDGHKKGVVNLRKRGVTLVLKNKDVIVYSLSKAKVSATYNQTVTSNLVLIVKDIRLPDNIKFKVFMGQSRIPGGDWTHFSSLSKDE